MARLIVAGIALMLVVLLAALLGYSYGSRAVLAVQSDTRSCIEAATSKQQVIDRLAQSLSDLRQRHDKALRLGAAALLERGAEIERLQAAATTKNHDVEESLRADPDCRALAAVPVCPAITDRLWPAAKATSGGDKTGSD